ncbi:multiple sugar transport system permease protein [Virgibacillus natechei]|uniref:Multiple sugar transport system permease protein n=1 Tax=Virgibacillus natechei TaxID=1216297 RepID=A0ABS4IE88_9BACI|nr:sugar ABC transporter permease [Virgibacillus natechei]MBP1969257.1 multiple sugar transport system permease protein [Virgibacillus natechei]UZD12415.1 sugar ABC transporter permease [Virgibacillus natechei]
MVFSKKENKQIKQRKPKIKDEKLAGILFVSPMLLGLTVFVIYPVLATFILSFSDWNFVTGISQIEWAGFDNFRKLLGDEVFFKSLINNLIFILTVPITMIIALVFAVLIDRNVYLKSYFKIAFFIPYVSSVVAVAVVWQVLFNPAQGPINQTLISLGIENPPTWLSDPNFALISIMVIHIWISIGFNLIIYIAGLQSISKELYESADLDGANAWQKFRNITIPMVSPTTLFLLITGIISTFKVFDIISVLTQGGPVDSTNVLVWLLYETAFEELDIGYSSAIALVLFIVVFIITIIQWVGQKKWVNY